MNLKDSIYYKQADLLLEILPLIGREKDFALKGGSAINFFVRDLPRLSVDIDLTYLPLTGRVTALKSIHEKLLHFKENIEKRFRYSQITTPKSNGLIYKLIVNIRGIAVKIEPNLVLRGSVFKPQVKPLTRKAGLLFEKSVKAPILSNADLYGGKICAALDRQHPRDLFDVKLLLENEGITNDIRQAFIVYLLSHARPIIELLQPNLQDISKIFENEFEGMVIENIELEKLLQTRKNLISHISKSLTIEERKFIASFKNRNPQWDLFPIQHIRELPAIKWKLLNLNRMEKKKYEEALSKLLDFLEIEI